MTQQPPQHTTQHHHQPGITHPVPTIQSPIWWGPVIEISDPDELERRTRNGWALLHVATLAVTTRAGDGHAVVEQVVYLLGRPHTP